MRVKLRALLLVGLQLCWILIAVAPTAIWAQDMTRNKFRLILAIPTLYEGNFNSLPGLVKARPHLEGAFRALAHRGGFKDSDIVIRMHTDAPGQANAQPATEPAIVRALLQSAKESNPGDVLVFFFSGHGQYEAATETSFLYTSQGDPGMPTNRINLRHQVIEQIARSSKASVNLVLIDACQEPTSMSGGKPLLSASDPDSYARAQGLITLLSAKPPQLAWIDNRLGYGFFTAALIRSLAGGATTAKILVADVTREVPMVVRQSHPGREQEPLYLPSLVGGSEYSLIPSKQRPATSKTLTVDRKAVIRLQSPYSATDIFAESFIDFAKSFESPLMGVEVLSKGAVVPDFQVLDAVAAGTLSAGAFVSSKRPLKRDGATFIRCGNNSWLAWNSKMLNAMDDTARVRIYEVCANVQ